MWRHLGLYVYRRDVPARRSRRCRRRRSNRPKASSSCARSSTAIESAPSRRRPTPSASTLRRTWNACGGWSKPAPVPERDHMAQTDATATREIHLRDRRRRLLARQGPGRRLDRLPARRPRLQGRPAEVRPVHQRRPGHDEPVPARRGLRHRRRRRDGPRPRATTSASPTWSRRATTTGRPARSTCRSSRRNGAATTSGAPSRSFRTSPTRSRTSIRSAAAGRGRAARRDRRHGRRHREPAVPRGHPPVAPGRRPREHALHPPDAGAVHRLGRRTEDQADAAQRPRPAVDRHPARRPALPHRPAARRTT